MNRSVQIRQPIDLQTVGVTWLRLADGLEEQASQLEADAAARNTRDAAEAELALRKRIQAANYRATAQAWRKLTRDSWLILIHGVPADGKIQRGPGRLSQHHRFRWQSLQARPVTLLPL
ncbi:MAG: hypothetical protein R2932_32625 [Caldilineaceae bacterium]